MGVTVRQQKRDGNWYIHIVHGGRRAAHKCVSEEHALVTQQAVLTAIAAGQFDLAALKRKPELPKEEKAPSETIAEFFDKTMSPLWEASLAPATFSRYELSFRLHIR